MKLKLITRLDMYFIQSVMFLMSDIDVMITFLHECVVGIYASL